MVTIPVCLLCLWASRYERPLKTGEESDCFDAARVSWTGRKTGKMWLVWLKWKIDLYYKGVIQDGVVWVETKKSKKFSIKYRLAKGLMWWEWNTVWLPVFHKFASYKPFSLCQEKKMISCICLSCGELQVRRKELIGWDEEQA